MVLLCVLSGVMEGTENTVAERQRTAYKRESEKVVASDVFLLHSD